MMNDEDKVNVCLSFDHEFGAESEIAKKYILWELDEWLNALDRNGFAVISKKELESMKQRLMRIEIDQNRGLNRE